MSSPILRTWALARTYRRGHVPVPVLRRVDLEVHPGEWVAILGPSGCGKSTLLHTASGGEILDLFGRLHASGRTVLMITHDPGVAARAQRRLLLSGGALTRA